MKHDKDPKILDLLDQFALEQRGWEAVDHWDADLLAIGIARIGQPRRLAYVALRFDGSGRFDFECESPTGPADADYEVTASGERVDYTTLVAAIDAHLGSAN